MRLRVPNFVLAAAGVLCIAAIPSAGSAQGDALPEGPGKAELSKACTLCHGVDQISAQRKTPEEWSGTVERMVGFGERAGTRRGAGLSEHQLRQGRRADDHGRGAGGPGCGGAGH